MSNGQGVRAQLRTLAQNRTVLLSTGILAKGLSLASGLAVLLLSLLLWLLFLLFLPLFRRIDRARGLRSPIEKLRLHLSPKAAWQGVLAALSSRKEPSE